MSDEEFSDASSGIFEVEKIIDKRIHRGKTQYLVRWLGYNSDEDTWEPIDHLDNVKNLIQDYNDSLNVENVPPPSPQKRKRELNKVSSHNADKEVLAAPAPTKKSKVDTSSTSTKASAVKKQGNLLNFFTRTGAPKRAAANKQEGFSYSDAMEMEDDVNEEPQDKKKTKRISQKSKQQVKSTMDLDDSDFSQGGSDSNDDSMNVDPDDSDDLPISKSNTKKSKIKNGNVKSKEKRTVAPKTVAKKKIESTADPKSESNIQNGEKISDMVKNFKPQNAPAKEVEPYIDAVGFDPTGMIVEGIIMEQVKKIGNLLMKAIDNKDNKNIFPLRLQTACSGTDAPSIALTLVKECLDKLFDERKRDQEVSNAERDGEYGDRKDHNFDFEHVMSCEIEPYKQSYIARNFPDSVLYPDITRLCDEDVVDVYGRQIPIPGGNLFVAGTSCKDFSSQKTTRRKDIEDKGTSGETFLAAVEFLEKFEPEMGIFENVLGAPWEKMEEYVSGRVVLKTMYDKKGSIKKAQKGSPEELIFSVNENHQYVVEKVPICVGVKAGSIVEGIVSGPKNKEVNILRAPSSKKFKNNNEVPFSEIVKVHKINMETDILVFEKKCRYCTKLQKVDSMYFGLPQQRNRTYMFIWKSSDPYDDLGEYWSELVKELESPVKHSIDAFLLPPSHDRVRSFREALRSGPGQMVARMRERETYFWENYKHRDLQHNKAFRSKNGMSDTARTVTNWDRNGRLKLAPSLWPERFQMWIMRIKDLIDAFHIAAARDTISRDPLHHSYTWNVSQNATMLPVRGATPGVCGCITPGGDLHVPHLGRTILGCEKLLLQGIPVSRLHMGNETEVQLSDLAGNAMTLSVVCATMLAAVCAPQLRIEKKKIPKIIGKKDTLSSMDLALSQKFDSSRGAIIPCRGDLFSSDYRSLGCFDVKHEFRNLLSLADDAFISSELCTCESSGTLSKADKIMQCEGCGVYICHNCCDIYTVQYHDMREVPKSCKESRVDPIDFERRLRIEAPAVLRLGHNSESILENEFKDAGHALESYSFKLMNILRGRGFWTLIYGAVEDFGSGRQVAEIRVNIGRSIITNKVPEVCAYLKCFAPSLREVKPHRGPLLDHARLRITKGCDIHTVSWELRRAQNIKKSSVTLIGSDEQDSYRVEMGLSDRAANDLFEYAKKKKLTPEGRFNSAHYHKRWKKWPNTIVVSGDGDCPLNGTYTRLSCRQTIALSALWRREDEYNIDMYIYIRPDVFRTRRDVAVFSHSPSYKDGGFEVAELTDWIPEHALEERTHETEVKYLEWKSSNLQVHVAKSTLEVTSPAQISTNGYSELCSIDKINTKIIDHLCTDTMSDNIHSIELKLGGSGTLDAMGIKKFSTIAGPLLLKYAAEKKLPLNMTRDESSWTLLQVPTDCEGFGKCSIIIPPRPIEKWCDIGNKKFNVTREYDHQESNSYYMALLNRPKAWRLLVEKKDQSGRLIIQMNPLIAGHLAANPIREGRDIQKDVEVSFRLSELSSMVAPDTEEFKVPNSNSYTETVVENLTYPLYSRQAKALTRMIDIEEGRVLFTEEERSEHVLPGVGWCLIGRARHKVGLRGGVLGDAIGSGKTVVTIALILADIKEARRSRSISKGHSGATLIAVPPGLIDQWDDERKKFTESRLTCIKITSTADLKKWTVKDIIEADIVLIPVDILEDKKGTSTDRLYTSNLTKMAKSNLDIPPAPRYNSQKEAPTIEGTWVPCSNSIDPFVGNKGDQKRRDEAAYYSHCYAMNINSLRKQAFDQNTKGVPLEWFTWRRVVVDECHETLCTAKGDVNVIDSKAFTDRNRRGARELLGVAYTSAASRPLRARCVWGLTGTPLLETEARVTELANLMGSTYITGAAFHWRKEERESGRDMFLNNQDDTRSRDYRNAVQTAAHEYVKAACQRNRGMDLQVQVTNATPTLCMPEEEYTKATKLLEACESFNTLEDLAEEELEKLLKINACSEARCKLLLKDIDYVLKEEPMTKIIVFADVRYGGHEAAREALDKGERPFAYLSGDESVAKQNEIISWFRHVDVTSEDRERPRILLLSFEQAAGHNLQQACHNVIMFEPKYSGRGNDVTDASVEQQAIGRVFRQGQLSDSVRVSRLIVKTFGGDSFLDNMLVERNTDEMTLNMATSNFD